MQRGCGWCAGAANRRLGGLGGETIACVAMREESLGMLLDNPVEQRFFRTVARIVALRCGDGAEAERGRARLGSEHLPDWSASIPPAQWIVVALQRRLSHFACQPAPYPNRE